MQEEIGDGNCPQIVLTEEYFKKHPPHSRMLSAGKHYQTLLQVWKQHGLSKKHLSTTWQTHTLDMQATEDNNRIDLPIFAFYLDF